MNACEKFQQTLAASSIEPAEEEFDLSLAQHLASCPACRAECSSYQELAGELKSLTLPDPGDLFFQSQLRRIEAAVRSEIQVKAKLRRWWQPSLALAAAVVLLFIGLARWQGQKTVEFSDWRSALTYLSEGDSFDAVGGMGLDELNAEQLDRLASNMEDQLFQENSDAGVNDGSEDWNDLSGPELDRVLQRLQTSTSRSHS